jgi:hypothetical protein
MQAYEGYLENDRFFPIGQPVKLQGRRRVILTVFDDAVHEPKEKQQAKAWREFFDTVNGSDESIPETFERMNFSRGIDL